MTTGQAWRELYKIAVLETDWSKMEERIQAAESAIKQRLQEFSSYQGGTPEENQAIVIALDKLRTLRADLGSWQGSKRTN
jgi:hypothetical protein